MSGLFVDARDRRGVRNSSLATCVREWNVEPCFSISRPVARRGCFQQDFQRSSDRIRPAARMDRFSSVRLTLLYRSSLVDCPCRLCFATYARTVSVLSGDHRTRGNWTSGCRHLEGIHRPAGDARILASIDRGAGCLTRDMYWRCSLRSSRHYRCDLAVGNVARHEAGVRTRATL